MNLAVSSARPSARTGRAVAVAPTCHDENALLERLRNGEDEAFEILVRAHGGRLLAVARHFFRSEEDARDAVQEAFLSAFRALPAFRGASTLSTWLHRILVNAALMKLRAGSRLSETSIEDLLPRFDETGHRIEATVCRPLPADEAVLRGETRSLVRAAVEKLPLRYRTVVILRDIQGLSTEETAKVLGVTCTAVKLRLHRARLALRTLLAPIFERPEKPARCSGEA